MNTHFTGHQKRVTLTLARLSQACAGNHELRQVLEALPGLAWELEALPQADVELIYAVFDEKLEAAIVGEFVADPTYLIDLGSSNGVCPLCGHIGCRWLFKIRNTVNQKEIECGSECIITHKLAVAGAETAEHARKILEKHIRAAIRKLRIEAWHAETGFTPDWLMWLIVACSAYLKEIGPGRMRVRAEGLKRELVRLEKFYAKWGWLTPKRWRKLLTVYAWMKTYKMRFPEIPILQKGCEGLQSAPIAVPVQLSLPFEDAEVRHAEATH